MSNVAIQFENVGKLYHLGVVGSGTLTHDLNRWWKMNILRQEDPFLKLGEVNKRSLKGFSEFVWALKDISFSIEQGDVVGIIGRNGAGKSTLLKLLSQITSPTTGVIRARGSIGTLLEVGTGFHPEMTGLENIYMNGSIMGMTRHEITNKLDDIVEFAGVARYIDTPVKRYSSGMKVRLGFAVAAFMEPQILVVDEVLAVGDAEFQQKAIGKINDVAKSGGRTVLFVSHNMSAVRNLCHHGIVLKDGMLDYIGDVDHAITHYIENGSQPNRKLITDCIGKRKSYIDVQEIRINDTPWNYTTLQSGQSHLDLVIKGMTKEPIKCEVLLIIRKLDGTPLMALAEGTYKGCFYNIPSGYFNICKHICLPHYLADGDYTADLYLLQPTVQFFFEARNCMSIHIEGFYDQYAHPINLAKEGFLGLESETIDKK